MCHKYEYTNKKVVHKCRCIFSHSCPVCHKANAATQKECVSQRELEKSRIQKGLHDLAIQEASFLLFHQLSKMTVWMKKATTKNKANATTLKYVSQRGQKPRIQKGLHDLAIFESFIHSFSL